MPYVILLEDHPIYGTVLTKGTDLPVYYHEGGNDYVPEGTIKVVHDQSRGAIHVANIPESICFQFSKEVRPEFNKGDVVINKKGGIPFRVSSWSQRSGDVWYQSDFGDNNNLAWGAMESDLRLATKHEKSQNTWALDYASQPSKKTV